MCANCNWEELLEEIADLQDDDQFEFADELCDISGWVSVNEHATERQKEAVGKIRASRE